ncbi:MAG TPA: acyltransferase, partial [Candidatus Binatia bacterium]|nr:acyltransferase [Candidatus Binatia bacterium]
MEKSTRIPSLDGIRGLAISLVLLWHIPIKVFRGHVPHHPLLSWLVDLGRFTWSGVDLFFVLSGFLIGGILLDAAGSASYFSTFYIRRAYRILPLYAVILVSTLIVYGTNQWHWTKVATELSWFVLFLQNFRTAVIGTYAFFGLSMTWSLAVEEQFYLTLPLVIRLVKRQTLCWLLLGIVLAAPVFRVTVVNVLKLPWIAAYILTPCRADTLCLGALIAIAIRNRSVWEKLVTNRKYLYAGFAFVCSLTAWMLASSFQPFTMQLFGLEYSLLALLYALLLLCTLISPPLSRLFSFRPLRWLGSIAYGLYLFHGMTTFLL